MLVNAYARKKGLRNPGVKLLWDYAHETPFQDIRGELFGRCTGQEILSEDENLRINAVLPNGARFYTDHAHPEYSTPECLSAKEVIACDKAGEIIVQEALTAMMAIVPAVRISVFKNNVDYQGHSYGCHENYLMDAAAHERCLVREPEKALGMLVPFLVTRQIFAGAGRTGGDTSLTVKTPYQVSQRADFIEAVFGLETMYARPILNTREEHHADVARFRRLHIILGDANMNEWAGFLKIGSTQFVLQMLEDGYFTEDLSLKDPVESLQRISARFDCRLELADGRMLTPTDIQRKYLEKVVAHRQTAEAAGVPEAEAILECWEYALDGLERLKLSPDLDVLDDPSELTRRIDWVSKLWLINRLRHAKNLAWNAPQLRVLDLQYHNIGPGEGVFARINRQGLTERILSDDEIRCRVAEAPTNTRAYFRGKCVEKFASEVCFVNWEVVGFDHGNVHRMVPLLNPFKGTQGQFEAIFEAAGDSRDLVNLIQTVGNP